LVRADRAGVVLVDENGGLASPQLNGSGIDPIALMARLDTLAVPPHELLEGAVLGGDSEVPMGVVPVAVDGKVRALLTMEWSRASRPPACDVIERRLETVTELLAAALRAAGLLETMRHQALHDPLTGLPNQTLFADRAALALARARRHGDRLAIGVLDLDRFKTVNDTLGHVAGDILLVQVADRLRGAVRAPDTVARMGGDEFTLLLPELDVHGEAVVAERLLAAFEKTFEVQGHRVQISPSIGLASFPADGDTLSRLLRSADTAMYRAKSNGRNTWALYAQAPDDRSHDRLTLEADLAGAVERRELRLGYQPMVRVGEDRTVAVEALVRWSHPAFGVLAPGEFLPLAEDVGLIADIDAWVLRQACLDLRRADAAGSTIQRVAVNLSARSLTHPSLLRVVKEALSVSGLQPERLMVEVSEAVTADETGVARQALNDLHVLGVGIALDDFGRRHAPLADLHDLPVDLIKIGRPFLTTDHVTDEAPVASAVVAMAHGLGLQVAAVGVETDEQLAFVTRLGCDLVQGNLIGKVSARGYDAAGASWATA
jgi:diguanylate cyclase (GGDEF)-like protein